MVFNKTPVFLVFFLNFNYKHLNNQFSAECLNFWAEPKQPRLVRAAGSVSPVPPVRAPAACAALLLSLPCSPAALEKRGKGALFWQKKQDCKSVDKNRANKDTVQDEEKDETKIYVKTVAALTH